MEKPACELDGLEAVLVGSFNPAIIHPGWLAKHGLISAEEESAAQVHLISPDVSAISVDQLMLKATRDKLVAETTNPSFGPAVRDLVVGIFQLLEHTPVRMLGMNRRMHFKLGSVDEWSLIAEHLAPTSAWQGILNEPAASTIAVRGILDDSTARWFDVKVEQSARVVPGVYIRTNEHYEAATESGLDELAKVLQERWDDAQRWAKQAAEDLLESARAKSASEGN